MVAHNFNFTPHFPTWFFSLKYCILDDNFRTKREFSDSFLTAQSLQEGGLPCFLPLPAATTKLYIG